MRKIVAVLACVFTIASVASAIAAPVQRRIPYKKTVSLVTPKTYFFRFSFYDAASAGRELWFEEKQLSPNNSTKVVSHNLGSVVPFDDGEFGPLDFSEQYWVQVAYLSGKTWRVLGSRDRLVAVPYALWSVNPGPVGETGPQGETGLTGPKGEAGATGSQGLAGAKGDPGIDGATVLNGTADPAPAAGNNGDFFLNTVTAKIFGPKTAAGWGAGMALVGPKGEQGIAGPVGPQGLNGDRGESVKVLDVDGNPICTWVKTDNDVVYCFITEVNRYIRFYNVEEVGNVNFDFLVLYFTSTNCQGQAYGPPLDVRYFARREPFTGKWYTTPTQTAQKQFLLIGSSSNYLGQCNATGATTEKSWVLPVNEVAMPFSEPIRGPLQFVSQ